MNRLIAWLLVSTCCVLGLSSLADDSKGSALASIRKELAEQGHVRSQYNLGVRYARGEGVIQDYKEAVKWFRLAAEQGDAQAQYKVGRSYAIGEGVFQNAEEAVKWFRLAAEQGHATALGRLRLIERARDYIRSLLNRFGFWP